MDFPVIQVGTDQINGEPIYLELDNVNVLITGRPRCGKTRLAQLIVEDPALAEVRKTVIDHFNQWRQQSKDTKNLTVHGPSPTETELKPGAASKIMSEAWHRAMEAQHSNTPMQSILVIDPHRPLVGMPETDEEAIQAMRSAKQMEFQSVTILNRLEDLKNQGRENLTTVIARRSKIFIFGHLPEDVQVTSRALELTHYETLQLTRLNTSHCLYFSQPGKAPRWVTITPSANPEPPDSSPASRRT